MRLVVGYACFCVGSGRTLQSPTELEILNVQLVFVICDAGLGYEHGFAVHRARLCCANVIG